MLDGDWTSGEAKESYQLRVGRIFTATIIQKGGEGIYAKRWVATLNQDQVTETPDLEYAKGRLEWEIITRLPNAGN